MFEPYYWYLIWKQEAEDAFASLPGISFEEAKEFVVQLENGEDISISKGEDEASYGYGHIDYEKSLHLPYYLFEPFFCTIDNEQFYPVLRGFYYTASFERDKKGYSYNLAKLIGAISIIFDRAINYTELRKNLNSVGYCQRISKEVELHIALNTNKVTFTRNGLLRVAKDSIPELRMFLGITDDEYPAFLDGNRLEEVQQYIDKLKKYLS